MHTVLILIVVVLSAWVLAYRNAPVRYWTAAAAALLGLHNLAAGDLTPIAWLMLVGVALAVHLPPLRLALLAAPLLRRYRRSLPPLSATEQQALDAGSVWWEAELFSGRPDWRRLLGFPAPRLSPEERAFLDGPVEALCAMLDDWRINDELHDLPPEVWHTLREQCFFGMIVPRRYGGLEFSAYAHSQVVMKLASRSLTAAITVMVPNSLGPAELLLRYGSERQKDHYLPRLAAGREIPCFALTGPRAGSDAGAIPDIGVVCRKRFGDRSEVLGIRLSWDKRYITLAPVATLLGLAFRLRDPERLLGGQAEPGITLALVPRNLPGVWIGHRHRPLDVPFQNGPTRGRDVFIPLDYVIGERAGIGRGWRMLVECLAAGRAISLPALAVGASKLACRDTGAYARIRRQFHRPIGRFEAVAEVLGRMAGRTYLMDAARTLTLGAIDRGERPAVVSAMLKYHLTERMRLVVNDAMDIHAGRGICLGPRNLLARVYQALPIGITVEGANLLTRGMILFGQGALRCHPFLRREMLAAGDPDRRRGLLAFDAALGAHLRLLLSNLARTLFAALGGTRALSVPGSPETRPYLRAMSRMSAALAVVSEAAAMHLGAGLKRRESLSARLGDVLSLLYLSSAAIKRFHDAGCPAEDLPLLRWACEDALLQMQQRLAEVLDNFPSRPAGRLLKTLVFPLGMPFRPPSDAMTQRAAELLLAPGPARERLCAGIYRPRGTDPLAAVEQALQRAVAAEAPERKMRGARRQGMIAASQNLDAALRAGILDRGEAARLRMAEHAAARAIRVDDFAHWPGRASDHPQPAAAHGPDLRLAG
jgi:acyl-CoA dehydrogenase